MKLYKNLIIGSGYFSIGYAAACPDTVVCEEHQICDTSFYLPLRTFRYKPYSPKTEEGARLLSIFNSLSLFGENEQNANGFEFALCKYVSHNQLNILLKCRVIRTERREDGIYDVTVQTNEGLTHLFAEKITDTTGGTGENTIPYSSFATILKKKRRNCFRHSAERKLRAPFIRAATQFICWQILPTRTA